MSLNWDFDADGCITYTCGLRSPNNENQNMEKKFGVWDKTSLKFKTYDDAEKEAKRLTGNSRGSQEYVIVQAIASTIAPVPEIEVVKL